jgi:hypothetical protein
MDVSWRKSTHSGGNGGNCIEVGAPAATGVAAGPGRVLVRDSTDPCGPTLAFSRLAWRDFAERARQARLSRA